MAWQLLLAIYLILATISFLLRRKLGESSPQYNKLVNWFFYLVILYPVGVVAAIVLHGSLRISLINLAIISIAELVFPLISITQYRANKDVDAGLFTILNSLKPIITITTA